jgi:putative zinc- or iron-chelating protein
VPHVDSIDKVVTRYFACVNARPFTYKGRTYEPKPLYISNLIHRGYTCPAGCGACCSRFSLDYLPSEQRPKSPRLQKRMVEFDGQRVPIYSDMQDDHSDHHCRNLSKTDGRCGIHGMHPFSCDFELIRFLSTTDPDSPNTLTQKLYGRAHAMLRIDGTRGAACTMTQSDSATTMEVSRKLRRLRQWCEHFGLQHRISDALLQWSDNGPWSRTSVVIDTEGRLMERMR